MIVAELSQASFLVHLGSAVGGYLSHKNADLCARAVARFLEWTHNEHHKTTALAPGESLSWLLTIITEEHSLVVAYVDHCVKVLLMKPNTVKNHVKHIETACMWLTQFSARKYRRDPSSLQAITHIVKKLRCAESKRNKGLYSEKTLEQQVYTGQLPAGGLPELRHAVSTKLPWAKAIASRGGSIDTHDYRHFLCTMFAAMWVFSAQGRPGGISLMTVDDTQQLLDFAFATTSTFKTSAKYSLQPITLSEESYQLVELYVRCLRPHVAMRTPPTDRLWITHEGKPIEDVGRYVTQFFRAELRLNVSTTGIRGLVETYMAKLHDQELITTEARNAVQTINGHSGQVTKDFYIKKARAEEVKLTRDAFSAIPNDDPAAGVDGSLLMDNWMDEWIETEPAAVPLPLPPSAPLPQAPAVTPLTPNASAAAHYRATLLASTSASDPPVTVSPAVLAMTQTPPTATASYHAALLAQWNPASSLKAADWGNARDDYGRQISRADWTDAEVLYIGEWVEDFRKQHPHYVNVAAKLLEHIRKDPAAVPIFHANHVLDSGRLRTGILKWPEMKMRIQFAEEQKRMFEEGE
mmetsp:Transcript_20277/g.33942  ORF Transcript_20277/g.33942 Transcript_20277/m.33942 type:complete len:580 (+) Transcript_20277:520-2259(+)|eukprot:CAMPEP_0174966680 /NCGR_PEP_ID=MMETSP0004_2-20121128/7159_1 /TAXON_ID=420556 /ORGANISM="Ochromonas sp., Strain CCMP1393" /LENGTH=579 /DNA_ID=CAMNT_0016215721 /DNA_START=699 /DNA_END=2438 /DNA_ORIENTATION=+